MKGIFTNIVFSGMGLSFFLLILSRMIPNDKLKKASVKFGRIISKTGKSRFGKKFWEGLENYIENSLSVIFTGLKEGWNEDDTLSL